MLYCSAGVSLEFITTFEFHENDTSPEVCVTLTDVMAGLDREVTASVEVMDGTAIAEGMYRFCLVMEFDWTVLILGEDFDTRTNSLTFLPCALNGTEICLNISIIDDGRVEYDETFSITLTVDNPLDTINGNNNAQADVTIVDNDG